MTVVKGAGQPVCVGEDTPVAVGDQQRSVRAGPGHREPGLHSPQQGDAHPG
ncbi:MAG: hypothetical protein ACRDQ5_07505 [Sciscionella sp.]